MEPKDIQKEILEYLSDIHNVFTTAKETGIRLGITSQKASGSLRTLEKSGKLQSKSVDAGMSTVKCYYLTR